MPLTTRIVLAIRKVVPPMMVDRPIAPDIEAVRALIDDSTLLEAARGAGVNA